tara:strand:- start:217 stop:621 length:405 start_codon:yes stop_codon:yes gene_type:complete
MTTSPEIYWVCATALLTGLLWLPYIGNQLFLMGPWRAVANSDPRAVERSPWAARAAAAHRNAVENLVIFAPLAIGVHVVGVGSEMTATACLVYFWARVGHYVTYLLGVPVVRTLSFALGVVCQIVLAAAVLGWA